MYSFHGSPRPVTLTVLVGAALGLMGCGGATGVRPDDMSAEQHRAAASRHEAHAGQHEEEFDPDARDTRATTGAGFEFAEEIYNPTQSHANAAAREHAVAEQHLQAAAALEAYEAEECGSFPAATRATCPLLGQLERAEDVDSGVRLYFQDQVNADAVYAHIRCHIAFARTAGREGMDGCPMYVPGVTAERESSGAVVLRSDDAAAVAEIRARARGHLAP